MDHGKESRRALLQTSAEQIFLGYRKRQGGIQDGAKDEEDVVHVYTMEYYSAIKKNETMPRAATWMDLEMIILSEVSQTENNKYHVISLICGI